MHPYRPLHVYDRRRDEPATTPEEIILAGLLILLGLARVVPAAWEDSFGAEATIAMLMLACGIAIVLRIPYRLRRLRRRSRHRVAGSRRRLR